jgi:hypothetical protein
MFVMTREPNPCHDPVAEAEALLARFMDRRMDELKRLREIGVQNAELLGQRAKEDPCSKDLLGRNGLAAEYSRVGRAVRQIMVLEMELAGLRKAPDRDRQPAAEDAAKNERPEDERQDGERSPRGDADALLRDDINDYDRGPLDQVVARIRKILRVEPPLDDPFVPGKPRDPAASAPAKATPPKPAPLKPAPQTPAPGRAAKPVVRPAAEAKAVRRPAPVAKAPPAQPVKAKKHRKRKESRRPDARMVRAWRREQQRAQARPPPPPPPEE